MRLTQKYNLQTPPGKYPFRKYSIGTTSQPIPSSKTLSQWGSIVNYIRTVNDIRKSMCGGCGQANLYDKNDVRYRITRHDSLDKVKGIVETIRKINTENAGQSL